DVLDHHAWREPHPAGRDGRVAPRVDGDVVAPPPELGGQFRDEHVLPAAVGSAEPRPAAPGGQRAGVLGDHGNPHRDTSWRVRRQSRRKRGRPYRSTAWARASLPIWRARGGSAARDRAASASAATRVDSTPVSGGTASTASVVASATTGRPSIMASISA